MANGGVSPARPPARMRVGVVNTPAEGLHLPDQINSATFNAPRTPNAGNFATLQLIGIDVAAFSAPAGASSTVASFTNLPYRDNGVNPLAALTTTAPPLTVTAKDVLIFVAFVQGISAPKGTVVGVTPQAKHAGSTAVISGPFLGGETYASFQASLAISSDGSAAVSGTVVGLLLLSVG